MVVTVSADHGARGVDRVGTGFLRAVDVQLCDRPGLQVNDVIMKVAVIVLVEANGHARVRDPIHGRAIARVGAGVRTVEVGEQVASIFNLTEDGNALGGGLAVFALWFGVQNLGGNLHVVREVWHCGIQERTPFERQQVRANTAIALRLTTRSHVIISRW